MTLDKGKLAVLIKDKEHLFFSPLCKIGPRPEERSTASPDQGQDTRTLHCNPY